MKKILLLLFSCFLLFHFSLGQTLSEYIDSADFYLKKDPQKTHHFLEKAVDQKLADSTEFPVQELPYVEIFKRNFENPTLIKADYWIKAAEYLKKYKNAAFVAYTYLSAADKYRVSDQLEKAKVTLDSALVYAQKLDYGYYSGVSYALQGLIYVQEANYYEARKSFKANLKLTKTNPPIQAYIRSFIELSTLYVVPEQIDSVVYYLNESIRLSDQIEYRRYQARARVDLAKLYLKIDKCDSALYYIEEANPFALKGDTMEILRFYLAAADVKLNCNQKAEALSYINSAIQTNEMALQDFNLAEPNALKAAYLIEAGQKQAGFDLYTKVLKQVRDTDRKDASIKLSFNLLKKIKEENPPTSEKTLLSAFEEVLNTFENKEYQSLEREDSLLLLELQAWYQFKNKETEKAYQSLDKLYQLQKKNYNQELVNKRLQIEGIYELNEKKIQLENEKEVSSQLKTEAERKNLIIWFVSTSSILLLFILLILLYVVKQRREKLKLQEEVNRKRIALAEAEIGILSKEVSQNKKELTTYTLEVINKNNLLRELSANLKKARKEEDFSAIERELNLGLKEKKDWKEFKERFEKVDAAFLENLKKKFPDLTKGQVRLASLIKLGFSSKMIAEFLNHSPASVDVARSKLRKKLNMPKEQDIAVFLESI